MRQLHATDHLILSDDVGGLADRGGAMSGLLVAVLVLAAVAVGAFFYFGGEADVNIKKPDVTVTSSETPG